jgi:hypothetical protein
VLILSTSRQTIQGRCKQLKNKNLKIHFTLLILTILVLSSCKSLKNLSPQDYEIQGIDKENYSLLNGTYKNVQDTVFGEIVHMPGRGINENDLKLNDRLFLFVPEYGYYDSLDVKIDFVSKRKCVVSGLYQSDLIFSKKLRGKIKKGYFYVSPKFLIVPFFPIAYVHRFKRIRIGKTNSNNLVIDHTERMWAFALIAGALEKGRVTSIYEQIEKQK